MESWVVKVYSKIFEKLAWISILKWLEEGIPCLYRNKGFIDIWAVGHFYLSLLCLTVIPINEIIWIYGCARIFEVINVQINLLLFDQFRAEEKKKPYFVTGFRRTVLLLIHNYLEIVVWFALVYHTFYDSFEVTNICLNTVLGSLYFSLVTMTTLGYGDIIPKTQWGAAIVIIQILIGIFMALLLLARFVALLPRPEERHRKIKSKGISFLLGNKRPK
jgi:hypothetical protein